MIPVHIEEAIKDKFPDIQGQILTNAIALSNIDAAKYGYSLAQQSIQDEAIAFAKWMLENKPLLIADEQLYTKFKTEQDEQK